MKRMNVRYEVLGGHTHISIFTGNVNGSLGKAGDICMTNDEFTEWRKGTIELNFIEVEPARDGGK